MRTLVKNYINTFDQSALMREINEAFYTQNEDLAQPATAVMFSHDCRTNTSAYFRCSSMRSSSGNGEPSLP